MLNSEFLSKKPEFDIYIESIMTGERPLSFSSFKSFFTSPRMFMQNRVLKKTTPAMIEGAQFHMCCLEPEKYSEKYVVFDDAEKYKEIGGKSPRSTKVYKDWKAEKLFEIESTGKEIVSAENDIKFRSMSEYIRSNNFTNRYLSKCNNPESTHDFQFGGFKWIGKIDEMCDEFTVDLKKMADVSDKKIKWTVIDGLLDYQGALYSIPAETIKHMILAIDNDHNVNVVEIPDTRIEFCLNRLEYFCGKFRECAETDSWNSGKEFFNNQPLVIN